MKMQRFILGTLGFNIAVELYGWDCVIDAGDWLTPAIIELPEADWPAFNQLLWEAEDRVRAGRNAFTNQPQ